MTKKSTTRFRNPMWDRDQRECALLYNAMRKTYGILKKGANGAAAPLAPKEESGRKKYTH